MQSCPRGMSRILAISGVILAAGSTPPRPGLAPCESLISMARTLADATVSSMRSRENVPFASRAPKYPVPICQMRSPPCRWWSLMPPSPVFCIAPAIFTPRLMASTAARESEP